jgi:hypothetical protein
VVDKFQLASEVDHIAAQVVVVLDLIQNQLGLWGRQYRLILTLPTVRILLHFVSVVGFGESSVCFYYRAVRPSLAKRFAVEVQPRTNRFLIKFEHFG